MKWILLLLSLLILNGSLNCFSQSNKLDNIFYCFNNATALPNSPVGFGEQASLIKKLGYNGFGGKGEKNYFKFRQALDSVRFAMPEIYVPLKIEPDGQNYDPLLKEIIKDAKDRDLLVSLHLHSELYKNNKSEGDVEFAKVLTELADFAAEYNVKLAVYPHVSFYCESVDHTLKLVKLVNRPNLGAVFNLCHFLKVEGILNMEEQVKTAIPHLFMVSICGADAGDTKNMDWDRLIQPLGEGSFDTYSLVKLLKDNGYNEKFGLQCYNIKLDCEVALTRSMNAWNGYKKKYALEK